MVERYNTRSCRANARRNDRPLVSPCQSGQTDKLPTANGSCRAMMRRLQAIDFSIADTVLYLDAYPHCKKALAHYHSLLGERAELVRMLADGCHMPVTNCENTSKDSWDWINNPWPWELDANE